MDGVAPDLAVQVFLWVCVFTLLLYTYRSRAAGPCDHDCFPRRLPQPPPTSRVPVFRCLLSPDAGECPLSWLTAIAMGAKWCPCEYLAPASPAPSVLLFVSRRLSKECDNCALETPACTSLTQEVASVAVLNGQNQIRREASGWGASRWQLAMGLCRVPGAGREHQAVFLTAAV